MDGFELDPKVLQFIKAQQLENHDPNEGNYENEVTLAKERANEINNSTANKWGRALSMAGAGLLNQNMDDVSNRWDQYDREVTHKEVSPILVKQQKALQERKDRQGLLKTAYDYQSAIDKQKNENSQFDRKMNLEWYKTSKDQASSKGIPADQQKQLTGLEGVIEAGNKAQTATEKDDGNWLTRWFSKDDSSSRKNREQQTNTFNLDMAQLLTGKNDSKTVSDLVTSGVLPNPEGDKDDNLTRIKNALDKVKVQKAILTGEPISNTNKPVSNQISDSSAKLVSKQQSKARNQTRLTYSDGRVEIVNGLQ